VTSGEPPFGDLIREVADYHGDLLRNIKGIRVAQSLFDDLSADPADQAVAIAAETAGRAPSPAPLITRPFDYGTVITYPFVPHNWHATRYSDGLDYGVWYGSFEMETTVFESVYHWHRFVMDSYAGENRAIQADRRVFGVRCEAILVDLRGKEAAQPALLDRNHYGFTQRVGRYLKDQGQNGLLVKSARCDGTNAAILRQQVLSEVRDACYLTYWMNPAEDRVRVERTPGTAWLSIAPSRLY
jgi:hypothetical protein